MNSIPPMSPEDAFIKWSNDPKNAGKPKEMFELDYMYNPEFGTAPGIGPNCPACAGSGHEDDVSDGNKQLLGFGFERIIGMLIKAETTMRSLTSQRDQLAEMLETSVASGKVTREQLEALKIDLARITASSSEMPFRFSDIQRGLILFRTSNNAHSDVNMVSLTERVDALSQSAKQELAQMMRNMADQLSLTQDRLPSGHIIIEQADMPDGRVSQTVQVDGDKEYERIVSADEAYGMEP